MEIILKENVANVGFKDELVSVKAGYGRNFLIPTGKAVLATESAKKVLAENLKQKAFKEKSIIDEANKTATKISKLELKLSAKVSISTAKNNGCYNVVNTCSFSNTTDVTAANIAWEQLSAERAYDSPEQQTKERDNWMLLEGKRYFKERSFEFVLESLGIYENEGR